ncbi:MAG TPA: hypothetical protein VF606_12255 [Geminicoccaceae bacterium]
MRTIIGLWRGEIPLGRAFRRWGILGGGVVALFATLLTLALVAAGAPAWLAAVAFAAHVPWNLVLLVGIWRSAGRPGVGPDVTFLARSAIAVWAAALSVL